MVLLSESKEREAKEAKENASRVLDKESGEPVSDGGKKADGAVNGSKSASDTLGLVPSNQTVNSSVGAEVAVSKSNRTSNVTAALSEEGEKALETQRKNESRFVRARGRARVCVCGGVSFDLCVVCVCVVCVCVCDTEGERVQVHDGRRGGIGTVKTVGSGSCCVRPGREGSGN